MKLGALALILCAAAPAAATRYSREALLEHVRVSYPGVAAAQSGVVSARASLRLAQLGWAPLGDLSLTLAGTPEIRCQAPAGMANDLLTREANCLNTTYVDWLRAGEGNGAWNAAPFHGVQIGIGLWLQQPLYSFGRIEAQIESGKAALASAEESVRGARADAELNALRAFFNVKWGRAALATLDEELAKLKAWSRAIEDEMDGDNIGRYSEADLARIKVSADSAEMQRLEVERRLAQAVAQLHTAAGDESADVDEPELRLGGDAQPLDWYADSAERRRPEVKLLDLAVRSAEADRRGRLADLLPELALVTSINYSYASAMDTPLNYFFLRPNLFDGQWVVQLHVATDFGARYTRLQQARAGQRVAVARRDKGRADIGVEVARAWADHHEARERESRLKRAERVAHGWYAIVDDNLQRGLSVSSDTRELADAARTYFDFRLRHLQAVLDANLTLAVLERLAGAQ